MAEVLAAVAAAAVGAATTTFLPEVVNAFKNKKKKDEVKASIASIEKNINTVNSKVQSYRRRRRDIREDWQTKIADWRCLVCKIEDCIDKFNNNNEHGREDQFTTDMEDFKTQSMEQSKGIEDHIRKHDKPHNVSLKKNKPHNDLLPGQPDSPRNHRHPDGDLVGMEQPTRDISALVLRKFKRQVEAAKAAGSDLKVTKVISIVGSRGVGKTCLASQVYFHPRVDNSFPLRAFVSATGKEKETVVEDVLRELHLMHHASGCTAQDPRACLRSADKRCFIVVDDVHDLELGSAVINEFRKVTKVNAIIILTTTVQRFAQSWSLNNGNVYKMMPLSAQMSIELFRVHYGGEEKEPKAEEFGVGCDDGVPLAVITWAEYREQDPETCPTIWSKFGDRDFGYLVERMEQKLEHSYVSLVDQNLQTCLLYFSLFQPENSVRRGSLVRRWQAEGEEVGCGGNNCNKKSIENWKNLVDRNVLCPIQVSINEKDQGAKTCRASGAMLGYIISHKSRSDEGFARVCSGKLCPTPVIRRMSLQTHEAKVLKSQDLSRLRTLVVSSENKNATKAAALDFNDYRLLRVLDLEAYGGQVRVEDVCKKLKLLKYLSLRSASIVDDYVPQAIKDLKELETLDVGKEKVVRVHVDVLLLPKLKHLLGKIQLQTSLIFQANPEMFNTGKLETFAGFVTETAKGFPAVMKYMTMLRKVKVFFHPEASADCLSSRLADAIKKFLPNSADHRREDQRRSLSLDIRECKQPKSVLDYLVNAEGKLYSLKLCTSDLGSFPSFIEKNKLEGIEKLCISFHQKKGQQASPSSVARLVSSCQAIIEHSKDHLPDLKYLKVVVEGNFSGDLIIKKDQLKNLERICIQSTEILPKLRIEDDALTNLVSVHLISKDIGPPTELMVKSSSSTKFPQLKNLKEVALWSSSQVNDSNKTHWHRAGRVHPNSPQVLFIINA